MTINQLPQTGSAPATGEARAHGRRKLGPIAYVELGQDNGGILLNLGEGGFAVQSALPFQAMEFGTLRFQIPQCREWITARGRLVWMSENKTMAGIQFVDLPETAQLEIRNWLAAPDKYQPVTDKKGGIESPRTTPEAARPGSRRIQPPVKANPELPRQRVAGLQGGGQSANTSSGSQASSTNSEAQAQDFRFNDYSMFAADTTRDEFWIEAERQKRGSRRVAVLSVVMAALFFVLGATIGRSTLDRWIANLATTLQGGSAPSSATAPPAQAGQAPGVAPDSKESGQQEGAGAAANQSGNSRPDRNETSSASAAGVDGAAAKSDEVKGAVGEQATAEANNQTTPMAKGDKATAGPQASASSPPAGTRSPKQPTRTGTDRSISPDTAGDGIRFGEHSILVNAPRPGNPPFVVNLPSEAVSASPTVAISVRRSMQVAPRGGLEGSRSERVVIGRLVSHGDPFYPVEARNRRLEGGVEIYAMIGRTGQILAVRSVSGPPLLASAAMTAIREWRFEPTFIDGDPVETQAEITMVFRLP